jgi:putative transposase
MPRQTLIHIPDGIYSVVSKCNNDEFHFNAEDKFRLYLSHLRECKEKLGFELHDIVCMSNHVHELYRVPEETTIAKILHRVKGLFSFKFNRRFGRKDHFWRNKPFYRIVENEEYAFHLMNYFHWNPVRAGLVGHPAEWPFSGYRFHILGERKGVMAGLLTPLPGIDPSEMLLNTSQAFSDEIHRILKIKRIKFIGNSLFINEMNDKH